MGKYSGLYIGLMVLLIVWNGIQASKRKERLFPNILQIVGYLWVVIYFVLLLVKNLPASEFFFFSSIALTYCFAIEVWQLARTEKGTGFFWQVIFTLISVIPMMLNIAIVSGLII